MKWIEINEKIDAGLSSYKSRFKTKAHLINLDSIVSLSIWCDNENKVGGSVKYDHLNNYMYINIDESEYKRIKNILME